LIRPLYIAAGRVWQYLWRVLPLSALPLLLIPALWTSFAGGSPVTSDGSIHALRLVLLDYAIHHGSLYPRWLPQAAVGLGDPALGYYWLTGYYLSELVHLATGLDFVRSMDGAMALLIIVAGLGAFALARDLFGPQRRWAAFVAALAYMYSPFLLTNVVIRGALGETGAMALLPWILWSLRRSLLAERPAPYVLATALSLGGLAITHNTSLLLAPPLLLGYIGVLWWQRRLPLARLRWALFGLLAAMGISAFLWLPGLGDRVYLTTRSYGEARQSLPEHAWQWTNWLQTAFRFAYTDAVPFQIGLVQLALALAGLILSRRRDAEWLFLIVATLVGCLAIGAWTLPLWLGSDALTMIQFPWRLLTIVSLPLALFAGACMLPWRKPALQAGAVLFLTALIIYANVPRLGQFQRSDRTYGRATPPQAAHWESVTGWLGLTPLHEFAPLWAASSVYSPTLDTPNTDLSLEVQQASSTGLQASVNSAAGSELRFTTLYFPGWQVTVDGRTRLEAYPSTSLGLLTVRLPAGAHDIRVDWVGTALQRWATVLSLLTLALLAVFCWRRSGRPWRAAVPLALLFAGAVAFYFPEPQVPIQAPAGPIATAGVSMLGYRTEQYQPDALYIYPDWYVSRTPDQALRVHWALKDAAGQIVSEATARPYFDSTVAGNWPALTLVDDAYALPLPAGFATGIYALYAAFEPETGSSSARLQLVGPVRIKANATPRVIPAHEVNARLGDAANLLGYDVQVNRRPAPLGRRPLVAHPGDVVEYTLYWQALRPLGVMYRSYLHVTGPSGRDLAKQDGLAGSPLDPTTTWDPGSAYPEFHRIVVPQDAPSGLYTPYVAMYSLDPVALLPVSDGSGAAAGERVSLPQIKVVQAAGSRPGHAATAQLGDVGRLVGWDLAPATTEVRPGDRLVLTLYYQVTGTTSASYTRFVHLYKEGVAMAAQMDSLPQNGDNPTSAWVPGEVVRDEVTLTIAAGAAPGKYDLQIGFYDPLADGARLPIRDAQGEPLVDNHVSLTKLTVR
jgi:hypothetical protein